MDDEVLQQLAQRVAEARSRGAIKALGAELDRDPELTKVALALARKQELDLEPGLPGKKLVRALRGRQDAARVRTNPIRRDPGFRCHWCGALVEPGGARVRDHCPACLRGRHVDAVPGDRSADCGGVLQPVGFDLEGRSGVVIRYRCQRCGHPWRGRAHPDDAVPPSLQVEDVPGPKVRVEAGGEAPSALPLRVLSTVRRHGLWEPGQRVLVAVSGGLDSTVLLLALHRTQAAHGGLLEVMSLDHGLRPEAVAEVAQVARLARSLGLPFHAARLGIEAGPNLAARARQARREALLGVGADRIATGHHQDDQAETVLHHLLRGSGARGLRGMQPQDGPWVRPLLFEGRSELLAWATEENLSWVEDPSNPGSQRGRIRDLVPALDTLHGGATAALARSARLLAREDALLDDLTEGAWEQWGGEAGLALESLEQSHPAIALRLLLRLTEAVPTRADQLEAVLSSARSQGARYTLAGGWCLRVADGRLVLEREAQRSERAPPS